TYEINRVTIVTPAALVGSALLTHRWRGMTHADLIARCAELLAALQRAGARIARTVVREDSALMAHPDSAADAEVAREVLNEEAGREKLALFGDAKLVETKLLAGERVHTGHEGRRLAREYHKHTILHFAVPSALISTALMLQTGEPRQIDTLRERVEQLSRL